MKELILRLSKKDDPTDTYDLHFDLVQSTFLPKWINRYLHAAQRQDPISEPWAFYGFEDNWGVQESIDFLNMHIELCNELVPAMFNRKLTDVTDQDTLNYIHSVFELHHGKLDEWLSNPLLQQNPKLQGYLSQVNQGVHRCEGHATKDVSLTSNKKIRIVYFDIPKIETFNNEDYALFTDSIEFGGLYTLYADVGKNLESLASDNDDHHHDFVPNLHYSVDCRTFFYDKTCDISIYKEFYNDNKQYFDDKGYYEGDPRLTTGHIKLAQLRYTDKEQVIAEVSKYNNIQSFFIF